MEKLLTWKEFITDLKTLILGWFKIVINMAMCCKHHLHGNLCYILVF